MTIFTQLAVDPRYHALPVDLDKLHTRLANDIARLVRYTLGAKALEGHLSDYPGAYKFIDCSGWVRAAIAYSTKDAIGGSIIIPDGSVVQHDWFSNNGFKLTDYSNAELEDNHLRIAFIAPTANEAGHVWLILNGKTLESHGGTGPASRAWNTPVLFNNVAACYVVC